MKFNLSVDRHVKVWQREKHTVEAETIEEAIKILSDVLETHPLNGTCDLPSYNDECETLYDTEAMMESIMPTIEIINEDSPQYTVLWDNIFKLRKK